MIPKDEEIKSTSVKEFVSELGSGTLQLESAINQLRTDLSDCFSEAYALRQMASILQEKLTKQEESK